MWWLRVMGIVCGTCTMNHQPIAIIVNVIVHMQVSKPTYIENNIIFTVKPRPLDCVTPVPTVIFGPC